MAAITATNSATLSMQAMLGRARLQQARQEADQAQTRAQDLRQQANIAEQEVQKSQERVRTVSAQNRQSPSTYAVPRSSNEPELSSNLQDFLANFHQSTVQQVLSEGKIIQTRVNTTPTPNLQGQATGRIVHLQA